MVESNKTNRQTSETWSAVSYKIKIPFVTSSPQLCLVLLCGDYFHSEITIRFIKEASFDVKTVLNPSNYRFYEEFPENFLKHQISTKIKYM